MRPGLPCKVRSAIPESWPLRNALKESDRDMVNESLTRAQGRCVARARQAAFQGHSPGEDESLALVDPLAEDEMDPGLREQVQFFKGPLGVVPNSVRTMAHRAPIARAFTDLNVAVMTDYGAVTPEFKRLLGYVSSFASGCLYCQAHMILASERFGASEERLKDVFDFETSAHFTDAEKAALAFAQAATAVPNAVTPEVGERLRAHWPPEAIVEIMGVVALFGYLNRWNDSMGSALEDLPVQKGEARLSEATGWSVGKHR
jgi:uncharacterized peroxidase-related enzyme